MKHLPPAGVVQLSRERTKGCQGREGSSCWQWAQGQAWDNRAEDLTGGALCPGCLYPEGRPSRSLLNPVSSHEGCSWPTSSHSLLKGLCQEPLCSQSCRRSIVGCTFPGFTRPSPLIVGLRAFW